MDDDACDDAGYFADTYITVTQRESLTGFLPFPGLPGEQFTPQLHTTDRGAASGLALVFVVAVAVALNIDLYLVLLNDAYPSRKVKFYDEHIPAICVIIHFIKTKQRTSLSCIRIRTRGGKYGQIYPFA